MRKKIVTALLLSVLTGIWPAVGRKPAQLRA
jgi:hypothetical protein